MADNRSRVAKLTAQVWSETQTRETSSCACHLTQLLSRFCILDHAQVAGFYTSAAAGNYSIDGVYIDSTQGFGAPFLLNYKPSALVGATQPPVFDAAGQAAVLFAQDYLAFLTNLSDTIAPLSSGGGGGGGGGGSLHDGGGGGGKLFGNAMFMRKCRYFLDLCVLLSV
jgi:hypothetical protein